MAAAKPTVATAWNPTMGRPATYAQWVSYHLQNRTKNFSGIIGNGPALQAAWDKYAQANKLGAYDPAKIAAANAAQVATQTAGYKPYDPYAEDASYIGVKAAQDEWLKNYAGRAVNSDGSLATTGKGKLDMDVERVLIDNQEALARTAYDYEQGLRRVDAANAARGMFRSGARERQRAIAVERRSVYENQLNQNYTRAQQDAEFARTQAVNTYNQNITGARDQLGERNRQKAMQTIYGGQ